MKRLPLIPLYIHVMAPCTTEPTQILKKWSDHHVPVAFLGDGKSIAFLILDEIGA
jgi:hypothetical protein